MQKAAFACVLVLLCLFVGCPTEEGPTPEDTVLIRVGDPAPGFELVTLDGETFNLGAQRGKVVLVNFFATWCPPCRKELPHLEKEIWKRFDPGDFALLVVGREESDDVIQPFVDKHGYTFPLAGDPEMVAYSQYATRFIPRNFVIGPDGTVLYQSQGFERPEFDEMVAVIAEAIEALPEAETTEEPEAV